MRGEIVGLFSDRLEVRSQERSQGSKVTRRFPRRLVFLYGMRMENIDLMKIFLVGQYMKIILHGDEYEAHFGSIKRNPNHLKRNIEIYCQERYDMTNETKRLMIGMASHEANFSIPSVKTPSHQLSIDGDGQDGIIKTINDTSGIVVVKQHDKSLPFTQDNLLIFGIKLQFLASSLSEVLRIGQTVYMCVQDGMVKQMWVGSKRSLISSKQDIMMVKRKADGMGMEGSLIDSLEIVMEEMLLKKTGQKGVLDIQNQLGKITMVNQCGGVVKDHHNTWSITFRTADVYAFAVPLQGITCLTKILREGQSVYVDVGEGQPKRIWIGSERNVENKNKAEELKRYCWKRNVPRNDIDILMKRHQDMYHLHISTAAKESKEGAEAVHTVSDNATCFPETSEDGKIVSLDEARDEAPMINKEWLTVRSRNLLCNLIPSKSPIQVNENATIVHDPSDTKSLSETPEENSPSNEDSAKLNTCIEDLTSHIKHHHDLGNLHTTTPDLQVSETHVTVQCVSDTRNINKNSEVTGNNTLLDEDFTKINKQEGDESNISHSVEIKKRSSYTSAPGKDDIADISDDWTPLDDSSVVTVVEKSPVCNQPHVETHTSPPGNPVVAASEQTLSGEWADMQIHIQEQLANFLIQHGLVAFWECQHGEDLATNFSREFVNGAFSKWEITSRMRDTNESNHDSASSPDVSESQSGVSSAYKHISPAESDIDREINILRQTVEVTAQQTAHQVLHNLDDMEGAEMRCANGQIESETEDTTVPSELDSAIISQDMSTVAGSGVYAYRVIRSADSLDVGCQTVSTGRIMTMEFYLGD